MRHDPNERREKKSCPAHIQRELTFAGGVNPYGEPNFRVVWGWNRIVKMTGEWQKWEHFEGKLTDKLTGISDVKRFSKLAESVIETREVPKYLPANCWHLEKWCPPSDYGTPEEWRKMGEEVLQGLTIDAAGEYPERGEYELCYPLTDDLSCDGHPTMLVASVVRKVVESIRVGKERFSFAQRRAAIEQRERHKEEGFVKRCEDIIRNDMRPFASNDFVTVPDTKSLVIKP